LASAGARLSFNVPDKDFLSENPESRDRRAVVKFLRGAVPRVNANGVNSAGEEREVGEGEGGGITARNSAGKKRVIP